MDVPLQIPRLSLSERDARWAKVRQVMRERDLDVLVLWGWPLMWDFYTANARFLTSIGGNAEAHAVIFPLEGEPTAILQIPTMRQGWLDGQDWVQDIRCRKRSWAHSVATRLSELQLDTSRIGMDGFSGPLDPDGWLPKGIYDELVDTLPRAQIIPLDDMLEVIRAIKSPEELKLLRDAAELGDLMLESCRDHARPGVKECEVYARMHERMIAHGGEDPTLFLWACGPNPYPHPFRLPTMRAIDADDTIICEIHPKLGGYFTHVERTFALGKPTKSREAIYDGCIAAYEKGLEGFGPGKSITDAMTGVKESILSRGLDFCEAGIHGHGLASLEYPRFRHHALSADLAARETIGDLFQEGMVFAFNLDLVDPAYEDGQTGCAFAETLEITASGVERLHKFPTELQLLG